MTVSTLALFPQFAPVRDGGLAWRFLLLATVLNVIGLLVNAAVIVTAGSLGRLLRRGGRLSRVPNILLGGVFAGLAVRLAWAGQRQTCASSD